ncbi:CRISPR-associated protein Cas4 [Chitinophaga solisilvae]|uniref:CRISPR-associated protein Cas4 n=1 Tax=Chitinophaga solisilvae TaxID=1233460 RepID=UPI001F3CC1E6|nr:CRISPR-associated protein Cas4 [Chitinophaga solisilvae]
MNLYHVCPRECWLHASGIRMEHTSDVVYDGKLLHESSYPQRAEKYTEIELGFQFPDGVSLSGKIDFYDVHQKVIHETKRSDKVASAHEWQSKFYIWLFELNNIFDVHAVLEYPRLRQRHEVWITEQDRSYLKDVVSQITVMLRKNICPSRLNKKICGSCSYYDLCYVEENES